MATAFWKVRKDGRRTVLLARWRDSSGKWRDELRPNDRTIKQALEYARGREREADLQSKGLTVEVKPVLFGHMWDRWWELDGSRRRSKSKFAFQGFLEKHLAQLRPVVVTPGTAGDFAAQLDQILDAKEDAKELSPQSLNHLRSGVNRMFEHAKNPKLRLWAGDNPIQWVKRRDVPRTVKETLAQHEVKAVLDQLPEPKLGSPVRWAAAICLYTGARPGEAFGPHKADVDLAGGVITLRHSWGAPYPKNKKPRTVLIVPELRPYLEAAMEASPNHLVLPRTDGKHFEEEVRHGMVDHLRRAIVKAGYVVGYQHTCRRCKGREKKRALAESLAPRGAKLPRLAVFSWRHPDADQRECPTCGMKLWAKALPRPLRFYDLRHTHATVLRRAHVDLGAVQKGLGHSDPRITSTTYDHSELEGHRAQFTAALTFNGGGPSDGPATAAEKESPGPLEFLLEGRDLSLSGRQDLNLRPLAPQASTPNSAPEHTTSTEDHCRDNSGLSILSFSAPHALSSPIGLGNGGPGGGPGPKRPWRAPAIRTWRMREMLTAFVGGAA